MKEDVLEEIQKVGIQELTDILLAYTHVLLKGRYWQTGKSCGPNGETEDDFVYEALSMALTQWEWNKQLKPDIVNYLKSRIESLISNAIYSGANKSASSADIHTDKLEVVNFSPSPEQLAHSKRLEELMDNNIKACKKDDNDRIYEVYEAMKCGFQTQDIRQLLDMEINQVNNYKKRIRHSLNVFNK